MRMSRIGESKGNIISAMPIAEISLSPLFLFIVSFTDHQDS